MMIGELEFDDTFVKTISKNTTSRSTTAPENPFPEVAFVFVTFFLLLMCIILMNLLVCSQLERFISLVQACSISCCFHSSVQSNDDSHLLRFCMH